MGRGYFSTSKTPPNFHQGKEIFMIKRLTAFFLTISLVLSMSSLVFSADASDITLNYLLTCNGKHSETVPTGTEIVVEYAIKNITNEDDFTVYTIQNEIY